MIYIVWILQKITVCLYIRTPPNTSNGAVSSAFASVSWDVGDRKFKSSRADQKDYINQPVMAGFLCLLSWWGSYGELLGNNPLFFDTVIAAKNSALHHRAIIILSRSDIIDDVRNHPKTGCDPVPSFIFR